MGEAGLLDHPWLTRHKLDVGEYHRMGEAGILGEDDRVELIEGELIQMAPIGSFHAGTVNVLTRLLVMSAGDRAIVAVRTPVRLGDQSEPQPDFALLVPRGDAYQGATPTPADVLLIIEVADTSARYDRAVKLPLYAGHGIPEVWIVDLEQALVEVCREPGTDGFALVSQAGAGALLEPARLPGMALRVSDILG